MMVRSRKLAFTCAKVATYTASSSTWQAVQVECPSFTSSWVTLWIEGFYSVETFLLLLALRCVVCCRPVAAGPTCPCAKATDERCALLKTKAWPKTITGPSRVVLNITCVGDM
jgi:hypothetical protein